MRRMLARSGFDQDYVEAIRTRTRAQLAAFESLAGAGAAPEALEAFASTYFNALVVGLEQAFVHRARGAEKKDGNPLNEVRVLTASLLEHDGVFTADATIKMKPETSVLGLAYGDEIRLDQEGFTALAEAFLAEIAVKFPPKS